jgi:DNA repair ATPase RecN
METSNQKSGVDTLTLQLKESIKYELLKRENKALKEEIARLKKKVALRESIIHTMNSV